MQREALARRRAGVAALLEVREQQLPVRLAAEPRGVVSREQRLAVAGARQVACRCQERERLGLRSKDG